MRKGAKIKKKQEEKLGEKLNLGQEKEINKSRQEKTQIENRKINTEEKRKQNPAAASKGNRSDPSEPWNRAGLPWRAGMASTAIFVLP